MKSAATFILCLVLSALRSLSQETTGAEEGPRAGAIGAISEGGGLTNPAVLLGPGAAGVGVAAGVRVATYQFEFQTSHLGESSDTSVAFVGEARVQRQLHDRLFVGLAARPMLATDATSIGPEGETDVYDEPPFTVQLAVMLGVEL